MSTLVYNLFYAIFILLLFLLPTLNLTFFVKPNKKILIIYSLMLYIFLCYGRITDSRNLLFGVPTFYFIYLLIIYKKILISVVLSGFIWILEGISDGITGGILIYILKYNYSDISNNSILDLISQILIVFFTFILSKLMRIILLKFFNQIDVNFEIRKKRHLTVLFSILIVIFAVYRTLVSDYVQYWDSSMVLLNALNLFTFFIFIVAVIYYGFSILINKHKNNEYLQLKDYTSMIENMYSDLRSFRHDYFNILSTLETYIQNEDIDGLKKFYYNDLLPESNLIVNKDISLSLLSHIKISPLKALLSSKISTAHTKEIDVTIELIDDIDEINMSTIDICRIIGILLDNAIEASILCDSKFIHFAAIKTDNEIILNISNSCLSSTPPVHKLYEKNFSTKGDGRGIGLNNIKEIINKRYKNILFNTSIDNCIFKQELIIHNK